MLGGKGRKEGRLNKKRKKKEGNFEGFFFTSFAICSRRETGTGYIYVV